MMRSVLSTLLISLLACTAAAAPGTCAAKIIQPSAPPAQSQPDGAPQTSGPLTNEDVLKMVAAGLAAEVVVEKMKASPCDFDTSPEALSRLKAAGVPDSLLLLMVMSPRRAPPPPPRRAAVRVPEGTTVELETAYTFDSQLTRKGDAVSFRVVNPVVVEGQVVVEKGATATALVTQAERGGHFGRAGRIAWALREVTAADGSRIPVQFSGRVVGDSKGAKVATQMVVMGGLLWPIAPVVLFHGFKRGGNAVVPEGRRFDAAVAAAATVNVIARQ